MSVECQLGIHYDFTHKQYLYILKEYSEDELMAMYSNNRDKLTRIFASFGVYRASIDKGVELCFEELLS